ncbi:MAG: hypothetical protein RMK00_04965 [Bacteroidota bacterium]|nr:hypothetical protein [Chlorobiota bacterium]MDW8075104.1 hypothetical protein [Bacteroidota bacterium]
MLAALGSCRSATQVQQEKVVVPAPVAIATAGVSEMDSPAPGDYAIEFHTRIGVVGTLFFRPLYENKADISRRLQELANTELVPVGMESRRYLILGAKSEAKQNRELIPAFNDAQQVSTEGGVIYLHANRQAIAILTDLHSVSADWLPVARLRGNAEIFDILEQMRRPDGSFGEEVTGVLRLP